jgi:hypothetical protein
MPRSSKKLTTDQLGRFIYEIRGERVMLDSDLAVLYGVPTKQLNEQYRRNRKRFPEDFAFQLTAEEARSLRSQIATSRLHGGRRYRPYAFTEHGALQVARVPRRFAIIATAPKHRTLAMYTPHAFNPLNVYFWPFFIHLVLLLFKPHAFQPGQAL